MLEGFHVVHLLHLHDEMNGVTAFSAAEALAYTTGGRYGERWGLVVVERAQSFVARTSTTKCHIVGNNVNYVGSVNDAVYGGLWYHVNGLIPD
jgi:hypothetical protein